MGVLKNIHKLKASSLVETIAATIIITIIFTMATVGVTQMLKQSIDSNTHEIDTELQRLSYLYRHQKVKVPDTIEYNLWNIEIQKEAEQEVNYIVFTAKNSSTKKVVVKKIIP
jgi:hypothetical protein